MTVKTGCRIFEQKLFQCITSYVNKNKNRSAEYCNINFGDPSTHVFKP